MFNYVLNFSAVLRIYRISHSRSFPLQNEINYCKTFLQYKVYRSDLKTAWVIQHRVLSLWPLHIGASRAAVLQDFSSRFGAVDRIVNFYCCIVTKIYYFHIFLSHSVLVLSFSVHSQSQPPPPPPPPPILRTMWYFSVSFLINLQKCQQFCVFLSIWGAVCTLMRKKNELKWF